MTLTTSIPIYVLVMIIILMLVSVAFMAVIYFRQRTLDDIRADVYKLFLKAEHTFVKSNSGKQKMKWVLSQARLLLPNWIQLFVTNASLEKILQLWFDGIKDLLDDGKMNGS